MAYRTLKPNSALITGTFPHPNSTLFTTQHFITTTDILTDRVGLIIEITNTCFQLQIERKEITINAVKDG